MFIINLALSDLLYCGIHLPIEVAQHLSQKPLLNPIICKITAGLRTITIRVRTFFECLGIQNCTMYLIYLS